MLWGLFVFIASVTLTNTTIDLACEREFSGEFVLVASTPEEFENHCWRRRGTSQSRVGPDQVPWCYMHFRMAARKNFTSFFAKENDLLTKKKEKTVAREN